jgi:hypothetical protein
MNKDSSQVGGYTIVETLIFLAITSALFAMVAVMIGGQQARNEFITSVREVESRLQDIANDVSTGYYTNSNDFTCMAAAGGPPVVLPAASSNQGANKGCAFIGRVVQFSPTSIPNPRQQYSIFTIVGRQFAPGFTSPQEPANFVEALPIAVVTSNSIEQERINSGVTAEYVLACTNADCTAYTQVGSVGFFSAFSGGGAGARSGAGTVNLVAIQNTSIDQTNAAAVSSINQSSNYPGANINPIGGIEVCLRSNGTRQYARLRIGGNNRQLSVKVDIRDIIGGGGACPLPPLP